MKLSGSNLQWFLDFTLLTFLTIQKAATQTPNECQHVWNINGAISIFLELDGFHRQLTFVINLPTKMTDLLGSYDVIVKLELPAGLYVDPYELINWRKHQNTTVEYHINETINVEDPEYKSKPFSFTLKIKLNPEQFNISFPIHSRYHKPQQCIDKDNIQITMSKPDIYFNIRSNLANCEGVLDIMDSKWVKINYKMKPIIFTIPVGCIEHLNFVFLTTISVTIFGTLWLGFHILKIKKK